MANVVEYSEYQKLLRELTDEQFKVFADGLTEVELIDFMYDLEWQGRPKQQIPKGNWYTWLVKCGRGFGKTWLGAKVTPHYARTTERIALIGADIGEVRDVMIDGESGIRANARPDFQPVWNKTLCQLTYPNGARVQGYSGKEPESLRGPNNGFAWWDEPFKMPYQQEINDELDMTMRSGENPQRLLTSTPRPTAFCKAVIADRTTIVTEGSMYENTLLPKKFKDQIVAKYEGTRRGRQELYGEVLDDNPTALWKLPWIENNRVSRFDKDGNDLLEHMDRVVISVDPATTSNEETSDATGLTVTARKGTEGFVFCSKGVIESPSAWSKRAVELFRTFKADLIVAETNQGGDMVESLVRNVDQNVPYKKVTATRGKAIRAEPISALYEQGRIHHVIDETVPPGEHLEKLEDEQLSFNPTLGKNQKSPNEMDALVWGLTELFGESVPAPPQFFAL